MSKLIELDKLSRPREKAKRFGVSSLSDIELLALIIGNGILGFSVLEVSSEIINKSNGLSNLFKLSNFELKSFKGIGDAKSLLLSAIFELVRRKELSEIQNKNVIADPNVLYELYKQKYFDSINEFVILVLVSKTKKILKEVVVFKGSENNVSFSIKEIISLVLKNGGNYFYIIHTHPNGFCYPSEIDKNVTKNLTNESIRIGLHLIDHLIIGSDGCYSFLEKTQIIKI